jgi:LTXXQ motif family protein
MLKTVVGLVTVLFVAGSAYAQEAFHARLTPDDLKALTDARIAATKDVLKLTPEQTRFWPPVENAIRARAEARHQRIERLRHLAEQVREGRVDPVEIMRMRAQTLSEKGATLKQLADAWQPLSQALQPDQKQRLRLATMYVLHEVRGAVERRRMEMMESEEDDDDVE